MCFFCVFMYACVPMMCDGYYYYYFYYWYHNIILNLHLNCTCAGHIYTVEVIHLIKHDKKNMHMYIKALNADAQNRFGNSM